MKKFSRAWVLVLGVMFCMAGGDLRGAAAQEAAPAFPPFQHGETLRYRLQWPSGINLGEATFRVSPAGKELHLELIVEATLPQYTLRDSFSAVATLEDLCSVQFHQKIAEGERRWEESIEFDPSTRQATRTRGKETTTFAVPECPRDPLTFLYYFRRQLAAGLRVASGAVQLGSSVAVHMEPGDRETAAGQTKPVDRYVVTYTGPKSSKTFQLWLSTDAARAPVRIRVPFPLAEFTAELQ